MENHTATSGPSYRDLYEHAKKMSPSDRRDFLVPIVGQHYGQADRLSLERLEECMLELIEMQENGPEKQTRSMVGLGPREKKVEYWGNYLHWI